MATRRSSASNSAVASSRSASTSKSQISFDTFEISSPFWIGQPNPETGKIYSWQAPARSKRSDDGTGRIIVQLHCSGQERMVEYSQGDLRIRKIRKTQISESEWDFKPISDWSEMKIEKFQFLRKNGEEITFEEGESTSSLFDEIFA